MFIQRATPTNTFGPFALRGTIPYHFVLAPAIPRSSVGTTVLIGPSGDDEIIVAQDSLINFGQLAVATCQRANGERNKVMRESWVRLCGTYQSKGGVLALPDVRKALHDIGTLYFAIPPPRSQAGNPLGDMMSSLFGGPSSASPARRALAPATAATALD
ncbi:hypothetical protein F5890DRAFT_1576090 [Lentinula detonsa]|uniref:Uncharacterized protein n=1 Tax=Lentinula detonsa TaxID=2804962 RepID=A0AA38ULS2_9AGAR|nr:hypothetical protein F5890DRAFT_1576090 [Lentinula detonsa]